MVPRTAKYVKYLTYFRPLCATSNNRRSRSRITQPGDRDRLHAAFTVGVSLFALEGDDLALARRRGEETLRLLPKHARPLRVEAGADDDF